MWPFSPSSLTSPMALFYFMKSLTTSQFRGLEDLKFQLSKHTEMCSVTVNIYYYIRFKMSGKYTVACGRQHFQSDLELGC